MEQVIQFNDRKIRMAGTPENPEWIGKDVCDFLGYKRYEAILARLPADEKGTTICGTLGGSQEMTTVTEPGLYRLIFGSKLPAAEAFKSFVFKEVLPSLRKNGFYLREKTLEARFLGIVESLENLKFYPREAQSIATKILRITEKDEEIGDMINLAKTLREKSGDWNYASRICRALPRRLEAFRLSNLP